MVAFQNIAREQLLTHSNISSKLLDDSSLMEGRHDLWISNIGFNSAKKQEFLDRHRYTL
jgi:hypothetical protein